MAHFKEQDLDLDGSVFYTDSYADKPVMDLVGTCMFVTDGTIEQV